MASMWPRIACCTRKYRGTKSVLVTVAANDGAVESSPPPQASCSFFSIKNCGQCAVPRRNTHVSCMWNVFASTCQSSPNTSSIPIPCVSNARFISSPRFRSSFSSFVPSPTSPGCLSTPNSVSTITAALLTLRLSSFSSIASCTSRNCARIHWCCLSRKYPTGSPDTAPSSYRYLITDSCSSIVLYVCPKCEYNSPCSSSTLRCTSVHTLSTILSSAVVCRNSVPVSSPLCFSCFSNILPFLYSRTASSNFPCLVISINVYGKLKKNLYLPTILSVLRIFSACVRRAIIGLYIFSALSVHFSIAN
ncbi:hypothetical protein AX774_g5825 [Zancudomyces culisetae]|uniref:Uncharacterized protein n=1 Tax=Zancudomyces culisetae TaxID=1213189 RepID=A0A1R1PIQ8_ZANCU|nr:hypothetical protein AX774_g5825 [Zancudomyces culisetae]|eukprot:OMH80732.1 hypothetical protein AX774_g5825 [Zancudomyces culisetae]